MILRWLKNLFRAATVLPGSNAPLAEGRVEIVEYAPKLVTAELAQLRFQTAAAVRQATAREIELQKACEDLAGAREIIHNFTIIDYCKRLGMVCASAECREDGCIRKRMEQEDATS